MVSSGSLIIFSYNLENNSFTTFSWRKNRLDNGRGIRNWKEIYLLYRGWCGTPLYIWQGRSVKVFEGRKKKRCSKNVKSIYDWNEQIFWALSMNISVLYHFCFRLSLLLYSFRVTFSTNYPWNSWYFAFGTFVSEFA